MAELSRLNSVAQGEVSIRHNEPELLERILLTFTYGTGASSSKAIFDFCFENVFDLLNPLSSAMWRYEPDQDWSLWVSRGNEMVLPNGFKSWGEANRASVLSRRTNSIFLGYDGETELFHVTSPVILRGESCYVLHLVGAVDQMEIESLDTFIQTLAYLIVNFKFLDAHSNSGTSHRANGNGTGNGNGNLSARQKQILDLITRDMTYQQIANRVGYSESTVKQEAMKIFRILGVHNRNEVIRTLGS